VLDNQEKNDEKTGHKNTRPEQLSFFNCLLLVSSALTAQQIGPTLHNLDDITGLD
jgi:hypothetical protein